MVERLITPSKITAWLECFTLPLIEKSSRRGHLARRGLRPAGFIGRPPHREGAQHERNCLQELEDDGRSVYQVPGRNPRRDVLCGGSNGSATRCRTVHDVIYQMPLVHEGIRGIADFLIRKEGVGGLLLV